MSLKAWEKKVLAKPGAAGRVAEIEDELRVAAGLTSLREQEGLSQRALADRIGVSQPRVAAIERSRNVTLDVLGQYVDALGGQLEVTVVKGTRRIPLVAAKKGKAARAVAKQSSRSSKLAKRAATYKPVGKAAAKRTSA
jgi:transcriptional regulator with XRE-family HTH domain